jgi:hypothetical protein
MVQDPAPAGTAPPQEEPPYEEVAPAQYSPETVAEVAAEQGMSDGAEAALVLLLLLYLLSDDDEHSIIVPTVVRASIRAIFRPFIVAAIYNTALRKSPGRKHLLDEDVQRQANTMVNRVTRHTIIALEGKKAQKFRELRRAESGGPSREQLQQRAEAWAEEAAATIVTSSLENVKETLARSLGLTHKKWLTRLDNKVRHSHSVLEGQTVPIDGKFRLPTGVELSRPGDPEAPLSERINCRCRTLYLLPGKSE